MDGGQTMECKICGKLYVFYSHMVGDQSVCPRCREKAGATGEGQVMRCKFCGKLYTVYPYMAGDQSACPNCVREARENMNGNNHETGQ